MHNLGARFRGSAYPVPQSLYLAQLARFAVGACPPSRQVFAVDTGGFGFMNFEWNTRKSRINLLKHAVSFHEAATVFGDPLAQTFDDVDHSIEEARYLTFGLSVANRALVVAHTSRGDTIRIISARPMTPRERRNHEQ